MMLLLRRLFYQWQQPYSFEMWFEEWRRKVLRGHVG